MKNYLLLLAKMSIQLWVLILFPLTILPQIFNVIRIIISSENSKVGSGLLSHSLISQLGRLQQDALDVQMSRDLANIQLTTVQELIAEKREEMDTDTRAALITDGGMGKIEKIQSKIISTPQMLPLDWQIQRKNRDLPIPIERF